MFKLQKNEIEYLVGNNFIENIICSPFDKDICDFLSDFSKNLVNNSEAKKHTDLVSLSFWCRKKNLYRMQQELNENKLRLGKGLAYHITPSNVPTNFFYSLIFGLLSGNSNLVKVPSKNFHQISIICSVLKKVLSKKKFSLIKKMITIIRYRDDEKNNISQTISKICDIRVIWGGDKTIEKVRKFPTKPLSSDITFADRYSISLINSSHVLKSNKNTINRLAANFYNDTMLMDQNACSSPHLIFWSGKEKIKASSIFWNALSEKIIKSYDFPDLAMTDKYIKLCKDISTNDNFKKSTVFNDFLHVIKIKKLDFNLEKLRGKWGYFYEYDLKQNNDLAPFINRKFQTLTYFGFTKDYLSKFFSVNKINGIDRVVPIGQGLAIDLYWDGYDIIRSLSKITNIT